jgi:hypothetical protein
MKDKESRIQLLYRRLNHGIGTDNHEIRKKIQDIVISRFSNGWDKHIKDGERIFEDESLNIADKVVSECVDAYIYAVEVAEYRGGISVEELRSLRYVSIMMLCCIEAMLPHIGENND